MKEELLQRLEAIIDLVSQEEVDWNVGDMVRFTADERDGVAQIEGLDVDSAKVRVMEEVNESWEPTDEVLNLPFANLSKLELDAEPVEEEPEEEPQEKFAKGTYVTWDTSEGEMTGIVKSSDDKKVVVEAIYSNELTGVDIDLAYSDLCVSEPSETHEKRIVCKVKSYTTEEDEEGRIGKFKGLASSYGNVDLGGDTVDRGAYNQTLKHNNNTFQLMFDHGWGVKDVGGVVYAESTDEGLEVEAEMPIHIPSVKEVYDKIKFMQSKGKPLGLSIGYFPVKSENGPDNTRILKEIALHEVSVTPYPMDTHARIREAKAKKALYLSKKNVWNKTDAPKGNRASEGDQSLAELITELKTTWRKNDE